ncbi:MAG: ABC transporter permease [Thermodesulfobacteriota bacterium]
MLIQRDIRLGIQNLRRHGLRSLLTMLGMVFGVGSVIAMLAVGEGASREALERIRRLGSTNILASSVKPAEDESGARQDSHMSVFGLTYDDHRRILETLPAVRRAVPVKTVRKTARLGTEAMDVRLVGTTPDWFALVKRPLVAGRLLLDQDLAGRANVVVLAEPVARRLAPGQPLLGTYLRLGEGVFEVVGVLGAEAETGGGIESPQSGQDVYLPISTLKERSGDITVRRAAGSRIRERVELQQILVEVTSQEEVDATAAAMGAALARFHPRPDFRLQVPLALLREAEATKRTFNIVLGSIAAISLVVGGIGIMNIMLASVTERTREIGIRRAVGAKRRHIVSQFLVETAVLSTTGGLLGVALGFLIPWIISRLTGLTTAVTWTSLVLSLGISIGVGLVFGLYPARRAADLDPMAALRHD